jgi:putative flavoprotein involved in K+ transport
MQKHDATVIGAGPGGLAAAAMIRRGGVDVLVVHLGVPGPKGRPVVHGDETHPGAPSLYFTGFTNPISGMFREMAIDAHGSAARSPAGWASPRAPPPDPPD